MQDGFSFQKVRDYPNATLHKTDGSGSTDGKTFSETKNVREKANKVVLASYSEVASDMLRLTILKTFT